MSIHPLSVNIRVPSQGMVTGIDDSGSIHVDWQNGSSLAVIRRCFRKFRRLLLRRRLFLLLCRLPLVPAGFLPSLFVFLGGTGKDG